MFPSTRYSLLEELQHPREPQRQRAQGRLVEIYWQPVYQYVRLRWRREPADAEDLTQSFFAAFIEREPARRFEPVRGSFHNFLRICLDNFARDAARAGMAASRGGGQKHLPLDFPGAEAELRDVSGSPITPEELFHREWQRQIFSLAVADLEELCRVEDKPAQWAIFHDHDLAAGKPAYSELAARHGVTTAQVTNYLHWARQQVRRLALDRIAQVSESPSEARTEARALFGQEE